MASKAVQRRLLEPSLSSSLNAAVCPSCRFASASLALRSATRRHATTIGKFRTPPPESTGPNTHLGKYLNQAPAALLMKDKKDLQKEKEKDSEKETKQTTPPPEENKIEEKTSQPPKKKETKDQDMSRGAPSEESVFGGTDGLPPAEADGAEAVEKPVHEEIEPEALMNVLNPEPGKTMAWQRKKLIQQIRNRGALTKEQQLARTERSCTVPSALFRTSTKKLVHLARQIAGKPIEEAIVQMQLSRKKVAQDIRQHLEYARNLAIVSRGMGLGKVEGREGEAVEIELKDGKRKIIKDRTGIYVEQAWVNKGEERMTPEYRGRGRVFTLTHRSAKITVVLKEEATRIRLSEERHEKLNNRKLWLHLPDRPVTLQRQYPLW